MNSTFVADMRDELRCKCGELKKRSRYGPVSEQIQPLVQRSISASAVIQRDSFAAALSPPQSRLETAAGHAVPTRRVLSGRRVSK
jgi:hypothetical protein